MSVHREKRKPSLYVTHDQTEAFAMADRIALIGQGKLQQLGTTDDLLLDPANIFVARFIGSPPMNLIWGSIGRDGSNYTFNGEGLSLKLPVRFSPVLDRYGKDRVVFGLRPDALAIATKPVAFEVGPGNTITAGVVDVEPLVGETVVTFKLGEDTWLSALFEQDDEDIEPGQVMKLALDLNRVRLFDPDTEQALKA
jgi:ABC-type sugar transport system ATPase subunit